LTVSRRSVPATGPISLDVRVIEYSELRRRRQGWRCDCRLRIASIRPVARADVMLRLLGSPVREISQARPSARGRPAGIPRARTHVRAREDSRGGPQEVTPEAGPTPSHETPGEGGLGVQASCSTGYSPNRRRVPARGLRRGRGSSLAGVGLAPRAPRTPACFSPLATHSPPALEMGRTQPSKYDRTALH
jgi:hypothetical protein